MAARSRHRGPHPQDEQLFGRADALARMRAACADLSWLLGRGYAGPGALKLVGDRYALRKRQRVAVLRCACGADAAAARRRRRLEAAALRGRALRVDGHNVLTTIEAALAGGVILIGRDTAHRDMASVHGTWRRVAETEPALEHLVAALLELGPRGCEIFLDAPVSNSGRLAALVRAAARRGALRCRVALVPSADAELIAREEVVATADSAVLERCRHWFDLAGYIVRTRVPRAWIVDLRAEAASAT